MKGLRSTLVLLAALIGLGAYIYFQGATPSDSAAKMEKVFPGVQASAIDEFTVKSESGDVTTLRKSEGVWSLVSPITARASENDASGVTNVLADMDIVRVVDENPTDLKDYGLDTAQMTIDFKADGGKTSGRLLVGLKTATGGNLYARRDDQKRVLLIGQFHEASLNKSTFDLRDKSVIKFDRMKVDGIDLSVDGKSAELIKTGDDWALTKPLTARADNSAVDGLLSRMEGVQMKSVASTAPTDSDLKKYGLDRSQASFSVRLGSARASLAVGTKADDGSVYVREASKPDVYAVEASATDDLKKPIDDYRRKEVFDFRAFNATRVELTRGGQTIVLERVKGKEQGAAERWRRVSPSAGEPDQAKVEGVLTGLADIRATSFVAAKTGIGLETPALVVVAKFDEGKKEERVTFGRKGAETFAGRLDDPGAAKIDTTKLDDALKALDEIAK